MNALKNSSSISQKTKHKASRTPFAITSFFENMKFYKKSHLVQMQFIQDFVLMIAKGYMLFVVENPWLKQIMFHLCGQVKFPF
jgi:hypothetical protein